ncbi:hypothetical protein SCALM49S_01311 [Streptomyces californicus]
MPVPDHAPPAPAPRSAHPSPARPCRRPRPVHPPLARPTRPRRPTPACRSRPPPPLPPRAPGARVRPAPAPPVRPPPPPSPRTAVFPAPWEAPGGRSGPRTLAAPRAPEPAEPGRAADAGAPHGAGRPAGADAFAAGARPAVGHLGERPPTYDAEPAALPSATSENLDTLVPDTVLDKGLGSGAYTLRTASVRGDPPPRFRGEPRRDGLLTARFGTAESALVLVALAGGRRGGEAAHLAAADACRLGSAAPPPAAIRRSSPRACGPAPRSDLQVAGCTGSPTVRTESCAPAPPNWASRPTRTPRTSAACCCPPTPSAVPGSSSVSAAAELFRLRDGLWQDLEPVVQDLEPVVPAAAEGARPGRRARGGAGRRPADHGPPDHLGARGGGAGEAWSRLPSRSASGPPWRGRGRHADALRQRPRGADAR